MSRQMDGRPHANLNTSKVKLKIVKKLFTTFIIVLYCLISGTGPATGAFLYKNYIIRQDRGKDILCDPYIVRKNDWVIKIFQRRGQIADQDFPEFLQIFSRLNPNIKDVNKIIPGQHILIPLKKLPKGALPGQASGIVTIPFVTVSKLPDMIKNNAYTYQVRPGDYVSGIISKTYGKDTDLSYYESLQLFKLLNPQITNLNKIYPGQKINIPDRTLGNKTLYDALFNESELLLNNEAVKTTNAGSPAVPATPAGDSAFLENTSFVTVAAVLEGKLVYQGKAVFPRPGQEDLVIDLTKYPIMELPDGSRVLFSEENDLSTNDKAVIGENWKGIRFITLPRQSPFEKIMDSVLNIDTGADSYRNITFNDGAVTVRINGKWMVKSSRQTSSPSQTPSPYSFITITYPGDAPILPSVKRYLQKNNILIKEITPEGKPIRSQNQAAAPAGNADADKISSQNARDFVHDFAAAVGFHYAENTDISFPYAGMQVNARSNLMSTPENIQVLVDFGDLYGDAANAIEATGLPVLSVETAMKPSNIISSLLQKLHVKCKERLAIQAVDRKNSLTISFEMPGFICQNSRGKHLVITSDRMDGQLATFLKKKGYLLIPYTETDFTKQKTL